MASPQTLRETERRLLAPWAVACAERVLSLFDAEENSEQQIQEALARAKAYGNDESSSAAEIAKRLVAVKVAKGASTAAGRASGRAVGQAAAVAHMGAHALGAAAYAVKAIALAPPDRPEAVEEEIR
jgi:hypothetical protein